MPNNFLNLMQTLTDEPLTGPLRTNPDFVDMVGRMELLLNPSHIAENELKPDKFCPLVSSGDRFKYVMFGLNPHEDEDNGEMDHLTTWEEIAEYHIPSDLYGNNTFHRVLGDPGAVVNYYRNIGMVISSLENKKFNSWAEFKGKGNNKETKKKYLQFIEQNPLAVAELIPFASEEFSLSEDGLEKLLHQEPRYKQYLLQLIDLILQQSSQDAWIICNGEQACNAFRQVLVLLNIKCTLIEDMSQERKYSLHEVNGRKVLMFHEFLRRRGGKLNTNEQIKQMVDHVVQLTSVAPHGVK